MAAVAVGAMVLLVIPVFGLEHIILTKPFLLGALAYATRRQGLSARDTVLSVATLPFAWVTIRVLGNANASVDVPGSYLFVVWLVFTVLLLLAVAIGTTLARRASAS